MALPGRRCPVSNGRRSWQAVTATSQERLLFSQGARRIQCSYHRTLGRGPNIHQWMGDLVQIADLNSAKVVVMTRYGLVTPTPGR